MFKNIQPWLLYSILVTLFWGVWGAFIEIPEKAGFPATLGFVAWAFSMVPPMLYALKTLDWRPETHRKAIRDGLLVGLTGAGGQLLLFQALRTGPAYIVFPFVSLYPVLTIFLSMYWLKERANARQWRGIAVALVAIFLLSWKDPSDANVKGGDWLWLSVLVFILWGIQAVVFKTANQHSKSESIFFYMALSGLVLSPIAYLMTDMNQPIEWGFKGPWLAFLIHLLNAVGALLIVYAFRYGKAMVVAPLTGLAPMITVVLSLVIYGVVPGMILVAGLVLAAVAIYLLAE